MISQRTVDEIYQKEDLLEVVSSFPAIGLKKNGSSWKGLSPFKEEKTPSFYVVPQKNIWKDFASGKGGSGSVSFLMEFEKLSYPQALEWLAGKYHIEIEYEQISDDEKEENEKKVSLSDIMSAAQRKFKEELFNLPEDHPAKIYIKERFTEDQIIKWGLGYSPNSWDFIKKLAIEKGILNDVITCGLVKKKSEAKVFDFFRDRIMIPIENDRGQVVSFSGRVYKGGDYPEGAPKYINGPETPIFNKSWTLFGMRDAIQAIQKQGEVIVLEGYTDVMALHDHGILNAVGSMGTALTDDHIKKLSRYTQTITLLFDGDEAGQKACERSIPLILKKGLRAFVIKIPEGQDPEEFIMNINESSEEGELEKQEAES